MTISRDLSPTVAFLAAVLAALPLSLAGGPFPPVARADPGSSCHFHGSKTAEEAVVLECAAKRIETLVAKGKVDAAWKGRAHDAIELVQLPKGKEWKVTFSNPRAKDPAKAKLYIFFSHTGNFLAANHTGK